MIAELFRRHRCELIASGLTPDQRKALRALCACRTPALGGHRYRCTECQRDHFAFHSCNHRLCPDCGAAQTAEWCAKEERRLLPVPYFLLTFTLPAQLRPLAMQHPRVVLPLLLREAAAALQDVCAARLGGEAGMLGVLHTATRQLHYHPHAHFIVPGGSWECGDPATGKPARWVRPKAPDFFLPVRVLSRRFRTRFLAALQHAADGGEFPPEALPPNLHRIDWVVHCQPAGSGRESLRYLAKYLFRAPISNRRILREANGTLTFAYEESASRIQKTETLPTVQFLKRLLLHVLPSGLHRVRRFGWLHPRAKKRLHAIQHALNAPLILADPPQPVSRVFCPFCKSTALLAVATIPRFDSS